MLEAKFKQAVLNSIRKTCGPLSDDQMGVVDKGIDSMVTDMAGMFAPGAIPRVFKPTKFAKAVVAGIVSSWANHNLKSTKQT